MKKILFISVICLFLGSGSLHAGELAEAVGSMEWKVGVEKVNITPQQSMWMAGYAARDRPSEGTLHDLWAKALAFEDAGGQQAVLVTSDLIRWPKDLSDRIRDRVEDQFGLTRAQILLNSSHTHTGPEVDASRYTFQLDSEEISKMEQYASKLEDQIVNMVGEALNSMEPAQVFAENGVTRFAVNRRNNPASTLHRVTELIGPSDHAVPVIKVVDAAGELKAVAFGYACHPTVLSDYNWSGDYAGFAQIELEKAYPGVTALFFQGAGADQNPLPRRTVALAEQYGRQLASAVQRVLNEDMRPLHSELATAYTEIDLKLRDPISKEELTKIAEESSENREKTQAINMIAGLGSKESIMSSYPYPLQVWQLGDQSLLSLGGELLVDYAIQLKRILGQDIFVLGYSNDQMGYIPSARVIEEGGYEGDRTPIFTSPWHPNIETTIIHEIVNLAEQIEVSAR